MQHALSHLGTSTGPSVSGNGAAATAAAAAAAAAAACWLPPADIVLNVGGRPFAAHRAVLSAHSGYLKALLVASDASVPPPPSAAPTLAVPNISPESFAPLLAFMYSGFLDLGPDNIYGVLLAAHLLHMPRALAFCRAFLLHQQQRRTALAAALATTGLPPPPPPTPPTTILKPIPSRKMLPVLVPPRWPPSHPHRPPHSPPHLLHTPEASPFRAVISASQRHSPHLPPPPLPPPVPPPILHVPFHPERPYSPALHVEAGPSNVNNRTPSSLSPCPSSLPSSNSPSPTASSPSLSMASNSRTPPPSAQTYHNLSSKQTSTSRAGTSNGKSNEANASVPSSSSSTTSSSNSTAPKVVLDVACCDGPVRFHRVLNDNYGLELGQLLGENNAEEEGTAETSTMVAERPMIPMIAERPSLVSEKELGEGVSGEMVGGSISRDDSSSVDVDSISSDNSKSRPSTTNATTSDPLYRCLYCNHTFKSHYCYQKHTRRHINPVALELGAGGTTGCGIAGKLKAQVVVKEVKLLDMNVQYYPCKTCGSKFPSYYFVHKHRKMCHAGEQSDGLNECSPEGRPAGEREQNAEGVGVSGVCGGVRVEGEQSGAERKFAPISEAAECQPKTEFSSVFKTESGGGKW